MLPQDMVRTTCHFPSFQGPVPLNFASASSNLDDIARVSRSSYSIGPMLTKLIRHNRHQQPVCWHRLLVAISRARSFQRAAPSTNGDQLVTTFALARTALGPRPWKGQATQAASVAASFL